MATPTYIPLAEVTLAAAVPEVTFNSISQNFTELVLVSNVIVANGHEAGLRFNSDSSNNYTMVNMRGTGSQEASSAVQDPGYLPIQKNVSGNAFITTQIMNYSSTDQHKVVLNRGNSTQFGTAASVHRWASNLAVSSMFIYSISGLSFQAGTTFKLFGIHGEV